MIDVENIFHPQNIRLNISNKVNGDSKPKKIVLEEMADLLITGNNFKDAQKKAILDCLILRENQRSTGLEAGVAVPHGRTDLITGFYLAVGIYPGGINFISLDMKVTKFVVCIVSDYDHFNHTILVLSEVMKYFQNPANAVEALQCVDPAVLCSLLKENILLKLRSIIK